MIQDQHSEPALADEHGVAGTEGNKESILRLGVLMVNKK
jgi:hypothetical protein